MINGRSRLQGADVEIANVTSKVETLSNQILINKEDIAALSNNLAINYTTTNNMNMLGLVYTGHFCPLRTNVPTEGETL